MRSRKFLNASSYAKVTQECHYRMVAENLQFLHVECRGMVEKERRHGMFMIATFQKPYMSFAASRQAVGHSRLRCRIHSRLTANV